MVGNGNGGGKLLEILNVRVIGNGNKALVLSHGFGTDQSVWNKIVPFLLRDHRLVLYDLACAGSVNPDHFDFDSFLNDRGYYGGFERGEIITVLEAMKTNYEAWVRGFAPLAVGADVPAAVREFSITLFNMRPDISLFVSKMVFESDLRGILKAVRVPCWVIQTAKDVSVPVSVAEYLKSHLGGRTTVEILSNTEGHLPHLSAPQILAPVLRRALASSR